jgi:hypothetical protein
MHDRKRRGGGELLKYLTTRGYLSEKGWRGVFKPRPQPFYTRETFFGLWGEKAAEYLEISSEMLIFVEFM